MFLQELISLVVLRVAGKEVTERLIQLLGLLVGVGWIARTDGTKIVLGLSLDTSLALYLPEVALHEVSLR